MRNVTALTRVLLAIVLASVSVPASAQTDLSGGWGARMHEDWIERWPGPDPVDFLGLPLNDDGRAKSLAYSASALSQIERQCLYYQPHYTQVGPFGFRMWAEYDSVNGRLISWNQSGAVDKSPRTIWMDGRARPSKNSFHTFAGFSTGRWEGNTLVVETTHMQAGYLRRNGVPSSDETMMTEFMTRHDDYLTVTAVIQDPAYLAAPHVISRTYVFDPNSQQGVYGNPCIPVVESPGLGATGVPHYLPGENPFLNDLSKLYNLPMDAILGGADTQYPEFRNKLKDAYKTPNTCGRYCCGWAGNDAPGLTCTPRSPGDRRF